MKVVHSRNKKIGEIVLSNLNVVIVDGHLTKNAELGYFSDQTAYCNFSLANNESYKKADGTYENIASFFDCAIKGKYAEVMCKHLLKGREVKVVGRLKQQRWEKDGMKYSRVIIKVEQIYFGANNSGNNNQESTTFEKKPAQEFESDDIVENEGYDMEFIPF